MQYGPFEDAFRMENGGYFMAMLVYQRVHPQKQVVVIRHETVWQAKVGDVQGSLNVTPFGGNQSMQL